MQEATLPAHRASCYALSVAGSLYEHTVHEGMVGGEIHVVILRIVNQLHLMLPVRKTHTNRVGHAPVVPVPHSAPRHDYSAYVHTVYIQAPYRRLVLRVDRPLPLA